MIPERWHVGLIPCTNGKNPAGLTPATLYRGGTFSLMMKHASQRCDEIIIMSARYGLLRLSDPVRWYDAYLPNLSPEERAELIVKLQGQAAMLEGRRILSYLTHAYAACFEEALPSIKARRPYAGLPHMPAIFQLVLTNEVRNYGTNPARR